MKAVLDTGPLIHLNQVNRLDILKMLETAVITREVDKEFGKRLPEYLEVVQLSPEAKDHTKYLSDRHGLEMGEASSLALCRQENLEIIFTDDLDARKVAEKLGFEPHGTLALVTRAYKRETLGDEEAKKTVEKLYRESSLFITRDLADWARKQIDEYTK